MADVIKLEREIYIEMITEIVHYTEGNKLVIYFDRVPFAQELSTHGLNKPGESFDDYCARMEYHQGIDPPNYPVPVVPLEVCLYGLDEMHDTVYISDGDSLVCWWDFNWDRCMDFGLEVGEYATTIPYLCNLENGRAT